MKIRVRYPSRKLDSLSSLCLSFRVLDLAIFNPRHAAKPRASKAMEGSRLRSLVGFWVEGLGFLGFGGLGFGGLGFKVWGFRVWGFRV